MEELGARIQDLWNGILDFTSKLVIPDWGSLIALLPILVLVLVVLFFISRIARYASLGPKRRGIRRLEPMPPAGVHAGLPSFAPFLAALGVFLVLMGLVVKGWLLVGGLGVLVITLLYWGREGMRDYDHVDPAAAVAAETAPALTAGGHGMAAAGETSALAVAVAPVVPAPPPGVHVPPPTFRPLHASLGVFLVLLGLVAGPWLALAGVFALVVALLGWLRDARREYVGVVEADRTGHPPADHAPRYPTGTLAAIAVVFAIALVLNTGLLPPKSGAAGGAGGSPAPSGAAGGSGGSGASGSPGAGGGGAPVPSGDVTIEAKGVAFVQSSATAPAGKPFTIVFDNQDANVPHNIQVLDSAGASKFKGPIFSGVAAKVYDVPALAAGSYKFVCDVHPNMTGTLTVQ